MNFRFTIVETSLNRAEFRWKWLRFLQHSFTLGIIMCLVTLGFGVAVLSGWIVSKALAVTFFALLAAVSFIAWAVIIISVVAGTPDRYWLASTLERVDSRLLDRLNTLLFLERRQPDARVESFALRIAQQTQGVFSEKPPPPAFSSRRAWTYFGALVVALLATVLIYQQYSPWDRLILAEKSKGSLPAEPD